MREVQARKKRRYKRENFGGTSDAATLRIDMVPEKFAACCLPEAGLTTRNPF
jgi:hypothetical protein